MTTDTIKALRDALTEVREMHIGTLLNPLHFNAIPDRIDKALALTADASEDAPDEPVRHEMRMRAPNGNTGPWYEADIGAYAKFSANPDIGDGFSYKTRALYERAARPAPVAATPAPDELLSIGATMGNVMYNLAQRQGYVLTDADCEMYSDLRKKWDAARGAAAPAALIAEVTDLRAAVVAEAAQVCRNAANKYEERGQRSGIGWQVCVWLEREIRALYTQPAAEHAKPAAQTGAAPSETRMDTHSQPLPADSAEHAKPEPGKFCECTPQQRARCDFCAGFGKPQAGAVDGGDHADHPDA